MQTSIKWKHVAMYRLDLSLPGGKFFCFPTIMLHNLPISLTSTPLNSPFLYNILFLVRWLPFFSLCQVCLHFFFVVWLFFLICDKSCVNYWWIRFAPLSSFICNVQSSKSSQKNNNNNKKNKKERLWSMIWLI